MASAPNPLEAAKAALSNADKLQSAAGGPYHEHSNASYAVAHEARKAPTATKPASPAPVKAPMTSGEDIGASLAAKKKNIGDYVKATSDQ
jgi:hypothetical protein